MGQHKNAAQDAIYIRFMQKHPSLAKGYNKGSDRYAIDSLWNGLAAKLNSHGPPRKNVVLWKKVWIDWKSSIKKKLSHNKDRGPKIGGGQYNKHDLTAKEESIAVACGLFTPMEGITEIQDSGKLEEASNSGNSTDSHATQLTESPNIEDTCSNSASNTPKTGKRVPNDDLEKGLQEHDLLLKSMLQSSKENAATLKSIESNTKELAEAFKGFNEENKRHHLELEKRRLTELTIKKQKLELQKLRLQLSQRQD